MTMLVTGVIALVLASDLVSGNINGDPECCHMIEITSKGKDL